MEPSTILWVWHGRINVDHCDHKNLLPLPVDKKVSNGPHPVRVPPKTALARATRLPGTHSSGMSNP